MVINKMNISQVFSEKIQEIIFAGAILFIVLMLLCYAFLVSLLISLIWLVVGISITVYLQRKKLVKNNGSEH
jgi:uncharacterized MAPEG superfamily protein